MKRSRVPRQEQDILSEEANSNPYAPPGAVVADFQLDAAAQVRPGTVSLAVRLLWIVCGLGALFILFKPMTLRPGASALWAKLGTYHFCCDRDSGTGVLLDSPGEGDSPELARHG